MRIFTRYFDGDRGASMVEYGLLVSVLAVMALSAVTLVGDNTEDKFTTVAEALADDDSSDPDQNDESAGESDDSNGPGGADDSAGPGGDDDDDSAGPGGDDDDELDQQGPGDDDDVEEEEEEATGPPSNPLGTSSDFTWWNNTKHGGNGAWKASVTYGNETDRHQYLTLEVTSIDEKGRKTTTTVNGFYVAANGSADFSQWDNALKDHKGRVTGVVEVEVKVTKIATSDQDWQPFSYDVDDDPVSVLPPSLP
jgi:Flp pilus assembly pilin Flp